VTVIVSGGAGQPALVELPRGACTVVHALARTSGFAALGGSRVTVQPHDPEAPRVEYDLSCAAEIRRALAAPPLQSGDVVSVSPATSNVVYAVGLLNSPGPIPVPSGGRLTLVQTLASAGGLVDFLDPEEATLWRRLPDGRTVRARIELAAILAGERPDIDLRAGDVLDVPHTAKTRVRQWLAESIAIGPFGVTAVYDPMADRRATLLQDSDNSSVYRAIVLDAFMQGAVGLVGAGP
jgi:protein involved in polysaccharide export with SLBB domain